MRNRFGVGALAVALALSGAACSDDSDAADDAAEQADAATTSTAPPAAVNTVAAVDYAFERLPGLLAVGDKVTLVNQSAVELHQLAAFRLPDGETRTASTILQLSPGEQARILAAGPTMLLLAPPSGQPQIAALGDGAFATPGRYVVLCNIPLGADPAAYLEAARATGTPPAVPGGAPHFTRGMFGEVNVA